LDSVGSEFAFSRFGGGAMRGLQLRHLVKQKSLKLIFVFHHYNNACTYNIIINLDIVLVFIYLTITFTRRRYPKHLTNLFSVVRKTFFR
jgi:hypothetical protein